MNYLAYSVVLGFVYIACAATSATMQRGAKWNASARDGVQEPLRGIAARLDRALQNFKETYPLFLGAYLALVISSRQLAPLAETGMQLYFFGRILYLPIYVAGIPYLRSLVWLASVVGIVLMLSAAM